MKCEVEGCTNDAVYGRYDMCIKHYKRWYKYGDTSAVFKARRPRYKDTWINSVTGYIQTRDSDGRMTTEHQLLAEKALGKRLPKGAEVHHMNGIKTDNYKPFNLVICPNHAYHVLLHQRTRDYEYAHRSNG